MKRLVAPAVPAVVVLILMLAGMAGAAQDNWRLRITADDGTGMYPANGAQVGVHFAASDGYSSGLYDDGVVYSGIDADTPTGTSTHVAAVIPGQTEVYLKNIMSPRMPAPARTWEVCVAANVGSPISEMRLRVYTVSSTTLPTTTFDGVSLGYYIALVDNKGMPGAPANGTRWEIPVPTAHSPTVPLWTCPINLPVIKLSERSNAALASEGYRVQLIQEVVPEPSSILALGSGLLGLAGYALRRRKA